MFQTALFLLCSVAVLHSGANTVSPSSSITTTSPVVTTTETTNQSTNGTTSTTPTTSTTTTPVPSTSTVAPIPTPVPAPEIGRWTVNDTNETCIIVKMAVQFNVSYNTTKTKSDYLILDLPVNETQAKGVCGASNETIQYITLSWLTTSNSTTANNLTLHFKKNTTKNQYSLHDLEVDLAPENFPANLTNSSMRFEHKSNQFTTGLANSYRCLKIQTLNLTKEANNETVGEITVSNLQFQAFHSGKASTFGFAEDCAFDTPDIVPIAVGCALALLVVIVLIAYLVGRRRSQARGYLSM